MTGRSGLLNSDKLFYFEEMKAILKELKTANKQGYQTYEDQKVNESVIKIFLDSMEKRFVRGTGRKPELLWHLMRVHMQADATLFTVCDLMIDNPKQNGVELWGLTCVDLAKELCNDSENRYQQILKAAFVNGNLWVEQIAVQVWLQNKHYLVRKLKR